MANKKKIRKAKTRRKNYLPTLIATTSLWLMIGLVIYFVDPSTFGVIPFFFILLFFAFMFTASVIFINSRRGFIFSLSGILLLILRYFGVGNVLNLILIAGIATATELYLSK